MKKGRKHQGSGVKKTNLVEGINNLIEEKAEKVEKSKKALKVVGKEKEATERPQRRRSRKPKKKNWLIKPRKRWKPTS